MSKEEIKRECMAFANWISNEVISGRSIEKLWRDYDAAVLAQSQDQSGEVTVGYEEQRFDPEKKIFIDGDFNNSYESRVKSSTGKGRESSITNEELPLYGVLKMEALSMLNEDSQHPHSDEISSYIAMFAEPKINTLTQRNKELEERLEQAECAIGTFEDKAEEWKDKAAEWQNVAHETKLEKERLEQENAQLKEYGHEIYEVYAGSEGIIPETAPEGYQQKLIKQMADIAAKIKNLKG